MGSLLDHLRDSNVITGVLKRVREAVMKQGVRMMLHTFEDATLLALKLLEGAMGQGMEVTSRS